MKTADSTSSRLEEVEKELGELQNKLSKTNLENAPIYKRIRALSLFTITANNEAKQNKFNSRYDVLLKKKEFLEYCIESRLLILRDGHKLLKLLNNLYKSFVGRDVATITEEEIKTTLIKNVEDAELEEVLNAILTKEIKYNAWKISSKHVTV